MSTGPSRIRILNINAGVLSRTHAKLKRKSFFHRDGTKQLERLSELVPSTRLRTQLQRRTENGGNGKANKRKEHQNLK